MPAREFEQAWRCSAHPNSHDTKALGRFSHLFILLTCGNDVAHRRLGPYCPLFKWPTAPKINLPLVRVLILFRPVAWPPGSLNVQPHLILKTVQWNRILHSFHFTDEKTGRKVKYLPSVTQFLWGWPTSNKSPRLPTALTPSGQVNLLPQWVYLFIPSGRALEGGWTLKSENLEIPTQWLTGRLEAVPWPTVLSIVKTRTDRHTWVTWSLPYW